MTICIIIVDVVVQSTPVLVRLVKYSHNFDDIVHLAPPSPIIVIIVVPPLLSLLDNVLAASTTKFSSLSDL